MPPEPEPECWLHPDIEVGFSPIAELGLFARAAISPGAAVSRLGGPLVTGSELRQLLSEAAQRPDHPYVVSITVGDDLHLVLPPGQPNHYGNHSREPNLWWADAYTLVARRLIVAGEQVTSDYATNSGRSGLRHGLFLRIVAVPGRRHGRGLAPGRTASPLRRSLDTGSARPHSARLTLM